MSTPSRSPRGLGLVFGVLALLVVVQLVPGLDLVDFHREEGRRVLPAREMLATGDWIVPRIWGQAYLSKPPGYFWYLAALFRAFGESELVARLGSVLAVLATSWAVAWSGARAFGLRAGLYGGALFVLAFETLTKARLAEIEASLTLAVFLAVALWWRALAGSRAWAVPAALAFAAALLLKGPAALVYALGAPVALSLARRSWRPLFAPRTLFVLGVGAALAGLWVAALFGTIGREGALAHWAGEVGGQGGGSLAHYAGERLKLVAGSLVGLAPAALVVLLALGTPAWSDLRRQADASFAFWAAASGWLFFLVFPGTNVRYVYPCLPFLALLAGALLAQVGERADWRVYATRVQRLCSAFAFVAVLLALGCFVGLVTPLGEIRTNALGAGLGLALIAVAVRAWREELVARRVLLALFAIPLLGGQVLRSQPAAANAARHERRSQAREVDALLPPDAPLHVTFWRDFNTLLYVEHEVRYDPEWTTLEPGAWVLVDAAALEAYEARPQAERRVFDVVQRRTWWDGANALLRLR
ncbi:MAG: glycosyltransferase family 39 protein [Planctomycetes bacterium]|nr:glycosyltransferase family 39 protein [Planctomycetota bacterium]